MRGIPKPRQLAPRQSKKPPCSCDLRLASRIAWYSGVSGACWPLPHGLVGSKEGCPPKVPTRRTPLHCPFQSGYLISSPAAAAPTTITSAAASGATFSAKAPIVLRQSIVILPCAGAACLRLDLSDLWLSQDGLSSVARIERREIRDQRFSRRRRSRISLRSIRATH